MIPRPTLTNKLLKLLNTGLLYIHGRAKDHSPILVLSFAPMGPLLRNKDINAAEFGALYNFYARYMINNMMIPGQVEKWFCIANINQFQLKEMPVGMFKEASIELGTNYIDRSNMQIVVNLTWVQNMIAKMLQKFLDEQTVQKQIFSDLPNPERIF